METYSPVYLDNAATTPVDPRVAERVLTLMTQDFGNSGSRTHVYGADALRTVNRARDQVAQPLGVSADEVVFTSGATEANNLALLGLETFARETGRYHIVSTGIEHKAVLEPLEHLARLGFEVTLVTPDTQGYVSADDVVQAMRDDTLLVSVMHANNETGAVQPISEIAAKLADHAAYFHVDAAQTFGRLTPDLKNERIDLVSLSGHKIFGPKGVGALVARKRGGQRVPLQPLMYGGGQERGLRPGTLPVPLIAGFGLASEIAEGERDARMEVLAGFRNEALRQLASLNPVVHGDPRRGILPNILSFAVRGIDSEALMVAVKDLVAISNGSACTSSKYTPSHVLEAMRLSREDIEGTVRLSWNHKTPGVDWGRLVERINSLRF